MPLALTASLAFTLAVFLCLVGTEAEKFKACCAFLFDGEFAAYELVGQADPPGLRDGGVGAGCDAAAGAVRDAVLPSGISRLGDAQRSKRI